MKNLFREAVLSPILSFLSCIIPKRGGIILFGSYLGKRFGDNSGALYRYLIERHKGEFRYIWLTDNSEVMKHIRSLKGEAYLKTSLTGIWLSLRAPLIVTSYGATDVLTYKPFCGRPKELHLSHGAAFRNVLLSATIKGYAKSVTCLTVISQWNAEYQKKNIPVSISRIKVTGFPRNDIFYSDFSLKVSDIVRKYNLRAYNILYAPHWRKEGTVKFFPFPDIDVEIMADFLRKRNMSIILRPHLVDMRHHKDKQFWLSLKNYEDIIKIITIDESPDIQLLLCAANCLITDYSSIQFDYLLLNRPIIYLPYDIDDFKRCRGGFHCDYEEFTPGPKPKTQKEFLERLDKFHKGEDSFKESRERIRDIAHYYQDGDSCRRVYEVIKGEMWG